MKYKVGDNVKVIAGDQKGSSGKIIKIFKSKNKALVEGINMVKKHNKPNANNPKNAPEKIATRYDSDLIPALVANQKTPATYIK